MIEAAKIEEKLRTKYGNLEPIADGVFRAVDEYAGRGYAIRYFDLADDLIGRVDHLREYQEGILSDTYFSEKSFTDLRWNHYLYFITSKAAAQSDAYAHAKAKAENDREYARKTVILENEIDSLLLEPPVTSQAMPDDLASMWTSRLEEKGLAYVLDDDVSVPEAARRIESGHKQKAEKIITPLALTPAEEAAAQYFLKSLTITGFRPYPEQKRHEFGRVNLIVGSNGTGKTSLLEAIEFLFCGQTRRPSVLMMKTAVSATFVGQRDELVTSAKTADQQLRGRHSQWYAKTELKKLTLSESFGKFNFLDTDAAVRLSSSDDSEERIKRDAMRLLLGSGAEKLNDRLERVRSKLEEFAKERERDIKSSRQLLTGAQQRLDVLGKIPQISDALFEELCAALKGLNWRVLPATKQETATIRQNLQISLTATQIMVRSKIDVLATSEGALLKRRTALLEAIKSATEVSAGLKDSSLVLAQTGRNQTKLRALLAALDALLPYAAAEYSKNATEMRECRQHVDSLTSRLSPFGQNDISADIWEFKEMPIEIAATTASAVLAEQEKRIMTARNALKAMEDTQAAVSVLRQRLLKMAQELLRKVPNPDHCPICHTEFEAGQLQSRMISGIIDYSESRLGELQTAVLLAEQELAKGQRQSTALSKLFAFVGDWTDITVGKAVEAITQARFDLSLKLARLAELEKYFQDLSARGLCEDDLANNLNVLGVEQLAHVSELLMTKGTTADKLRKAVDLEKTARIAIETANGVSEKLASSFGVNINATPEEIAKQLHKQVSDLDALVKAKGDLSAILDMKVKSLEKIAVQLEQAQSHLQKLTTAMAKEQADVGAATVEMKRIEELEGQIRKAMTGLRRLQEAHSLLDEMIGQELGGKLAPQILSENASTIGKIFTVIHTPNEFEIKTEEGKLVIWRRATSKAVSLFEMSAGQRAAYALSLFLAMNCRLLNGPRVLLFDDPIAHVDDMNVLSFLDHLRTLSIKGSRQLFFATADSKLAGLFRQKFRFLGKEYFREIELTRS